MKRQKYFLQFFVLIILASESQACFNYNQYQNVDLKIGMSYYQECHCSEPGYTTKGLKWLDIHGRQIGASGPGTKSNVYMERKDKFISLHISNASIDISGIYKCVTSFEGREYTLTYDINAYDPIYFFNTDEDQYIINGKDSVIHCEVGGSIDGHISWSKEDKFSEIISDEKFEITPKGLKVKNVTDDDNGIYKCIARDIVHGDEIDKFIKVKVHTLPIIEELKMTPEKNVILGESLSVECIANGFPEPEYIWNKTSLSKGLTEYRNVTWRQEANTIVFDSIEADDQGIYECTALNNAGEDKRDIYIEVHIPPTITEFNNLTVAEGSSGNIVCKVSARPKPSMKVVFDSDKSPRLYWDIRKNNDIEYMLNLTFMNVSRSHEGIYICNASNNVDFATEEMYLSVLHKPYFKKSYELIWGWNGETVNLSCENESNPPSIITWSYQGNDILTEEENLLNKLLLKNLNSQSEQYMLLNITNKKNFYGLYECTAKNDFGEAKKIIALREGFAPPAVRNVSILDITATSVTFTIEGPEQVDGPPVLGFTTDYENAEAYNVTNVHISRTWSKDYPFKLEKLKPMTMYYAKFAAVNRVGVGVWSDLMVFVTPQKSVPEPPTWEDDSNLVLMGSGSNQVLRWKAPEHNGEPIDFYVIRYCPTNGSEIKYKLCREERIDPTTELELNQLDSNTTYYLQLLAHNSEGNSTTAELYITTPVKIEEPEPILSAGAIIGIAIVVVIVSILAIDLIFLCWRKQGIIASCCIKKNKKRKQDNLQSRDKKGLLKDNGESTADDTLKNNGHKEYEYNKTTGVITGKHSAV